MAPFSVHGFASRSAHLDDCAGDWAQLEDAQAACYAADGYARASGEPAVVYADTLGDAAAVASGLLTSWGDKMPVLAVTCLPRKEYALVRSAYATVTRAVLLPEPDAAPADIALAVGDAFAGDGPVHVQTPDSDTVRNVLTELNGLEKKDEELTPTSVDDVSGEIWNQIRAFTKPLILLGRAGANRIEPARLKTLADKLQRPVLLTASATAMPARRLADWTAAFPDTGALIPSGNMVWVKAFASADGVIALGAGLSEIDWCGYSDLRISRGHIIQVNSNTTVPDIRQTHVCMDAAAFVDALIERVPERDAEGSGWSGKWKKGSRRWRKVIASEAARAQKFTHIEPRLAAHTIVESAPEDAIFLSEGGACGMWLWSYLWLRPLMFPTQNGTIGVPIPMARGVRAANPTAPLWCVVGDGAFFYHCRELTSLAGHGPVVIWVFNDGAWSSIRVGQTFLFRGRYPGTDLPETNYAAVSDVYGCETRRVETPDALGEAAAYARTYGGDAPLVIDVRLPKNHVPYAGANFVLAELDGATRSLIAPSIAGAPRAFIRRTLTLDTIRSLIAVNR